MANNSLAVVPLCANPQCHVGSSRLRSATQLEALRLCSNVQSELLRPSHIGHYRDVRVGTLVYETPLTALFK